MEPRTLAQVVVTIVVKETEYPVAVALAPCEQKIEWIFAEYKIAVLVPFDFLQQLLPLYNRNVDYRVLGRLDDIDGADV